MRRLGRRDIPIMVCIFVLFGLLIAALPAAADEGENASVALERLMVKAQSDDYRFSEREDLFGTWLHNDELGGSATTRDYILQRDMENVTFTSERHVNTGTLYDPYTGETIYFQRGQSTSNKVQIDHVVAVGEAYESGADAWTKDQRVAYANDPYVLLAIKGSANASKSDKDAANWLPSQKSYDCSYVSRQIGIKEHYGLSVDTAEKEAMRSVLSQCPSGQTIPVYNGNNASPGVPLPNPDPTPDDTHGQMIRLFGNNRYDTMTDVVDTAFPEETSTVIVTSGENYPDALAVSGFAGIENAPVLLTNPQVLSANVRNEIKRLKPSSVVIVGGEKAVSSDVETSLKQCVDGVERIQGATRIDTALQIYEAGKSLSAGWGKTAVVVTGGNNQNGFADALSVTSYAYAQKAPVFLSDAETGLTVDQQNALKDGNFTQIVIVGGAQAVPEFVSAQIEQTVGIKPIRIAGQTRYNTSILFARWAIGQGALTMNNVVFTTGQNYPDALSGGPLAGRDASCMLLVNNSDATVSNVGSYVSSYAESVSEAYILGGANAVSWNTAGRLSKSLGLALTN